MTHPRPPSGNPPPGKRRRLARVIVPFWIILSGFWCALPPAWSSPAELSCLKGLIAPPQGQPLDTPRRDLPAPGDHPAGAGPILEESQGLSDYKARWINLRGRMTGSIIELGTRMDLSRSLLRAPFPGTVHEAIHIGRGTSLREGLGITGRRFSRAIRGMDEAARQLDNAFAVVQGQSLDPTSRRYAMISFLQKENGENIAYLGIRKSERPGQDGAPPTTILLKVALPGRSLPQRALGELGINLFYASLNHLDDPATFLKSLLSRIPPERIRITSFRASGDAARALMPLRDPRVRTRLLTSPGPALPDEVQRYFAVEMGRHVRQAGGLGSLEAPAARALSDLEVPIQPVPGRKPGQSLWDAVLDYLGKSGADSHDPLRLRQEGSQGQSGDPVRFIYQDGKPVTTAKIYLESGADGIGREALANHLVAEERIPGFAPPRIQGMLRVREGGREIPVLFMEPVEGRDIRARIRELAGAGGEFDARFARVRKAVETTGKALARLHAASRHSVAAEDPAFRTYMDHELAKMSHYLGAPLPLPDSLEERGWVSTAEKAALARRIREIMSAYARAETGDVSLVHGDFHTANVVCDEEGTRCRPVDLQYLVNSVAPGSSPDAPGPRGTVDPLSDVGRFLASIQLDTVNAGLSPKATAKLQRAFLSSYLAKAGLSPESVKPRTDFHVLRFLLQQLKSGDSASPRRLCGLLDRWLRANGVRAASAPARCR